MQSIDDEEASPSAYAEPGVGATLCDALCFRPAKDNTLLFRPRNGQAGFESNPVSGVYQQPAFVEMLCKVVPICSIINLVVEFFILGTALPLPCVSTAFVTEMVLSVRLSLGADCVHLGLTVPHPNLCAKHTIFGDLFITVSICAPLPPASTLVLVVVVVGVVLLLVLLVLVLLVLLVLLLRCSSSSSPPCSSKRAASLPCALMFPFVFLTHALLGFRQAMIISFISTVGIHIEVQKGVLGYPWNYMCKRQKCEPWIGKKTRDLP